MKRITALLLTLMLFLTGCSTATKNAVGDNTPEQSITSGVVDSLPTDTEEGETNQPETNQPESNQPENNQPESNQPENNQPETNQPETNQPENNQPETNQPENNQPDTPSITHNYEATVTAPTCETAGYTTYTCSICADSYITDEISALDHKWQAATTAAPKTCTTCGETEGEKLPTPTPDPVVPDSGSSAYNKTLYVNYINVGQGDSTLIKVGDCDILIDGGKSGAGSTVTSYLKNKGVDDIELMINTHPDEDHYGGLTNVLDNFVVEEAWGSSFAKSGSTYTSFKNAVKNEGLTLKTPSVGTVYSYEYLTLTVIYAGAGASTSNDSSLVILIQYGSFRFLFTGDISSTIESKLVTSSASYLRCDVLKVPHHGSGGSSSSSFLKATGAKYGVICVGENSYGHPTSTALGNLSSAGISVYRTDTNGHVVFSTDGASLKTPSGSTVSGGSGTSSGSTGSSSGGSSSSLGSSSSANYDNFIGNKESKVFHLPTCSNLPAASKRNYLYDYWFIVNCIGYRPCQICLKGYTP